MKVSLKKRDGSTWSCFKLLHRTASDLGIPLAIAIGSLVGIFGVLSLVGEPTTLQTSIQQVLSASRASANESPSSVSRPSTLADRHSHRSPVHGRSAPSRAA